MNGLGMGFRGKDNVSGTATAPQLVVDYTPLTTRTYSLSNSGTIALGRFLIGNAASGSATITSSGSYATTESGAIGGFGSSNGLSLSLAGGSSNVFDGASGAQSAVYLVGGTFSGSVGEIVGTFSATATNEITGTSGVGIAYTGTAYDAASISKVQTGNVGNGGTISVSNAGGSYRSAALLSGTSLTGQGWSVTGFGTGTSAAAGATLAGTAHFDGTGLLSGTYNGTFSATFQNDQSLAGAVANDLGPLSWSLSQNYVNTSGSGATTLAANTALSAVSLTSGTGANATVASFAAGATGPTSTAVSMSFASGTPGLYSNVLDLHGTDGIAQVLQLTYDPSLLGSTLENSLVLAWWDPSKNAWVNSVLGNTGTNPIGWSSSYLGSWADYVASTSGSATAANSLGAFGVDTANKTVWAAINHNSQFAVTGVIIVPEPGALALAGIGIAAAASAYRRRRS